MNLPNLELNIFEKILKRILKKYTFKVYSAGVKYGYNWNCAETEKHI